MHFFKLMEIQIEINFKKLQEILEATGNDHGLHHKLFDITAWLIQLH